MEPNKTTHIYVGIFAILGIIVLFNVSVRTHADESISDGRIVVADFKNVRGLLVGGNVTYHGVRVGLVESIQLVPVEDELLARVRMLVKRSTPIYLDAEFAVQAATLLGTMEIAITDGTPDAGLLTDETPMRGRSAINIEEAMEKVTEGIDIIKDLSENLNKNQDDMFSRIRRILEANEEKINDAVAAFGDAGPKFQETMDNIREISQKVADGEGTLGKLITTSEMFDKIDKISSDVDAITAQIASGEGTMGKLVFSEEGLGDMKQTMDDISGAFDEIKAVLEENREQIAEAVDGLSSVGPNLKAAADDIKEISSRIEQGDGTLGKLVNDDTLYDEAKGAAAQLRETLEEAEEQTVLQSFFRIFTGGI
jgi:phospholipid/cholesterol/gamma-HCH transport system substrate-binding protein